MELSIVIVNYNVKHFLEQCLHSVYAAIKNIDAEVFVVDNNSVDGSAAMIEEKFSDVIFIKNTENLGFSVANNQAIRKSQGKYILLLNPDTIVEEDTFSKVINFMNEYGDAGGLGVKMIDGKGHFLPESKRALPTPWVSFFKIFGFSSLFPKSKIFAQYHLGYLSYNEVHSVEVLAGAFMLLRKDALDKVGLLDEDFFMYGEDIDLSYRIIKGGYKNYYYPETTIIHFKGESTKKGSLNYVRMFYKAMIIYANKHFTKKKAVVYKAVIQFAIYLSAFFAILKRKVSRIIVPTIDALLLYSGFTLLAPLWGKYRFDDANYYDGNYLILAVPLFILVWLGTVYFTGGYEKPVSLSKIFKGFLLGTVLILVVYALLPETLRFSRALILFGTLWGIWSILSFRLLLSLFNLPSYKLNFKGNISYAIVSYGQEVLRIKQLIEKTTGRHHYVGAICPGENCKGKDQLGDLTQIREVVVVNKIDELVFSTEDLTSAEIIKQMLLLAELPVTIKIATAKSFSIIGSNSIETAGDLYAPEFNNLIKPSSLRKKRLFDILTSTGFVLFMPFLVFLVPNFKGFLTNIFFVLFGIKTWVGIYRNSSYMEMDLPAIKPGVISWVLVYNKQDEGPERIEQLNLNYAKDYRILNDLQLILRGYRYLGKT